MLTQLSQTLKACFNDVFFKQNMWIRYGAVGFVAAVARTLNVADVHCNLLPILQPFLKQPVVQVDQEVGLFISLFSKLEDGGGIGFTQGPGPRFSKVTFRAQGYILKSKSIEWWCSFYPANQLDLFCQLTVLLLSFKKFESLR